MTITQEQATWFARPSARSWTTSSGRARQAPRRRTRPHRDAQRGPPAARGLSRHGQDLARPRHGADGAGHEHPHPVHARPAARRHHRLSVYDQKAGDFEFHPGPIFANIVLADEINRASPKTQSALLEVMEEGSVTVDGVSRQVGAPFLVIATQNPDRAGRHVPAAGGAARPLHDADVARLPGPRLDDAHPRGRGPAHADRRADHHARRRSSAWPTSPRRSTSTRSFSTTSPAWSTHPLGGRGAARRRACAARSRSPKRPKTRAAAQGRTYVTPGRRQGARGARARAPAHPRPRGRVRRRHPRP